MTGTKDYHLDRRRGGEERKGDGRDWREEEGKGCGERVGRW